MKTSAIETTKQGRAAERRTVLCVDPDESYAGMLNNAWRQLQLADDLHIVRSREEALQFLESVGDGDTRPAAVVLDPEMTGEETGAFMREVRKHCGKRKVPIMFWSRDSEKYEVLEGLGVDSVLKKPAVLRLVQSLDEACQLGVQQFNPHAGAHVFANTVLPPSFGETQ